MPILNLVTQNSTHKTVQVCLTELYKHSILSKKQMTHRYLNQHPNFSDTVFLSLKTFLVRSRISYYKYTTKCEEHVDFASQANVCARAICHLTALCSPGDLRAITRNRVGAFFTWSSLVRVGAGNNFFSPIREIVQIFQEPVPDRRPTVVNRHRLLRASFASATLFSQIGQFSGCRAPLYTRGWGSVPQRTSSRWYTRGGQKDE